MEIKTEIINGEKYICVNDLEKLFKKCEKDTIINGFYKKRFGDILHEIYINYNSQEEFAKLINVSRTYISQFINYQLNDPPKPSILRKIAKGSKGITTYKELMQVCGYLDGIEE